MLDWAMEGLPLFPADQLEERQALEEGPRLRVVDADTGEVKGDFLTIRSAGTNRARHTRTMVAFCRWAQANEVPLTFWTLGTDSTQPELAADAAQALMKALDVPRWCLVLEPGSYGGRWHAHAILEGEHPWEAVRQLWASITGLKSPHVQVQRVYSSGIGTYLAKYLGKSTAAAFGVRKFRTSRRLRREIAAFYEARPDVVLLTCVDHQTLRREAA